LDQQFYRTGQFACKAKVSERTLRYYDKVGLLSPSQYTESGHRLYTNNDLLNLQQILALKFLGFSLEEIKVCLQTGPKRLQEILAQQKAMMHEKRMQLNTIIQAIEKTEKLLETDQYTLESIVNVIQVIHMGQNTDWQEKYFTPEQRKSMEELSKTSYSDEARQKFKTLHPNPWTEADQQRVNEQYAFLTSELTRLVAEGADPASPDAQKAAKLQEDLLFAFTKGDPDVTDGLKNYWKNINALPADQQPIQLPYGKAEAKLLDEARKIYREKQQE
jgi:MerR family transcriptional regulator, thiopeptide resistance regulator